LCLFVCTQITHRLRTDLGDFLEELGIWPKQKVTVDFNGDPDFFCRLWIIIQHSLPSGNTKSRRPIFSASLAPLRSLRSGRAVTLRRFGHLLTNMLTLYWPGGSTILGDRV